MLKLKYSLNAETTDEGIVITGRTFDAKEILKGMGARWNAEMKAWVLPPDTDLTDLKLPPPEKKPRVKKEPVEQPKPWWFCGCPGARIISMKSQMHSCQACTDRINGYYDPCRGTSFVRGSAYRQDD